MTSFEIFTEKYSQIIVADHINEAIKQFYSQSGDLIIAVIRCEYIPAFIGSKRFKLYADCRPKNKEPETTHDKKP